MYITNVVYILLKMYTVDTVDRIISVLPCTQPPTYAWQSNYTYCYGHQQEMHPHMK